MVNKFSHPQLLHYVYPCISTWLLLDIIFFSIIPGPSLEDFSWMSLFKSDKVGHFLFYFATCFFLTLSGIKIKTSIVYMGLLGVGLECVQWSMHNGRSFDVLDIFADLIGTFMILPVFYKTSVMKLFFFIQH